MGMKAYMRYEVEYSVPTQGTHSKGHKEGQDFFVQILPDEWDCCYPGQRQGTDDGDGGKSIAPNYKATTTIQSSHGLSLSQLK